MGNSSDNETKYRYYNTAVGQIRITKDEVGEYAVKCFGILCLIGGINSAFSIEIVLRIIRGDDIQFPICSVLSIVAYFLLPVIAWLLLYRKALMM